METLITDLQDFTRQRRVRWESLFVDFDRHRNKRISADRFRRGLYSAGYGKLTEQDVAWLQDRFRVDGGLVDYQGFCDEVNMVFTHKHLEKKPTYEIKQALPQKVNLHYLEAKNDLGEEDVRALDLIMDKIANKVLTECVVLKRFFQDFDRHRNGFVSQGQFKRGLRMFLGTRETDYESIADVITAAYEDLRGDVNYRRFASDVDQVAQQIRKNNNLSRFGSPKGSSNGRNNKIELGSPSHNTTRFADELDVEQALDAMRAVQRVEGLRLETFFQDMDKMRKGVVSRANFQSAISQAFKKKVFLSEDVLQKLCDRYSNGVTPKNHAKVLRYHEFIDEIDRERAYLRDLHKDPTKTVQHGQYVYVGASVNAGGDEAAPETGDEDGHQKSSFLIDQIRTFVQTRRMNLKPPFEDFDRRHRGSVTESQFKRVVKQELNGMNLSEEQLDSLTDQFSRGASHGVSYIDFMKVVEPHRNSARTTKMAQGKPIFSNAGAMTMNSPRRRPQGIDREEVLQRLQRQIKTLRIRLREFLEDADRQRHGLITIAQFGSGLSRARIELTTEEIEALVLPYIVTSGEECGPEQRRVRWRQLVQEIELVELTTNLEKMPTHSGEAHQLPSEMSVSGLTESAQDRRETDDLLEQIQKTIATSRILLLPSFEVHDRHNTGKLSQALFRRALDSLNLKPLQRVPERAFELIAQRFTEPSTGNVNYRRFAQVTDPKDNYIHCSPGISREQLAEIAHTKLMSENARNLAVRGAQNRAARRSFDEEEQEIDGILSEIMDECLAKRIRIKEFLQDYDKLRKGVVPASKFKSALVMSGITSVTGAEIVKMATRFQLAENPSMVSYMPFVFLIDGGDEGLERNPYADVQERKPRSHDEKFPQQVSLDELQQVLEPIRQICRVRHICLRNVFERYDKQNLKAVTPSQFASVLKTNGLLPLENPDRAMEIIHQGFPAKHPEKINYHKFLQQLP